MLADIRYLVIQYYLYISLQLIIGCKWVNDRLVIIGTMVGSRTVVYLFTDSRHVA